MPKNALEIVHKHAVYADISKCNQRKIASKFGFPGSTYIKFPLLYKHDCTACADVNTIL